MVELEYGLLDSVELAARLPYLSGRLGKAHGSGFGDVAGEMSVRFLNRPDKVQAAAFFRVSYATGFHDHGHDIQMKKVVQHDWITGDPSWDFFPGLEAKLIRTNWALETRLEYWIRAQGQVEQDVGAFAETAEWDPGDGLYFRATGIYQVSNKAALRLGAEFTSLGKSFLDDELLKDQFQLLLLEPSVLVQFNREFDGYFGVGYTVLGQNTGYGFPWMLGFRSRF